MNFLGKKAKIGALIFSIFLGIGFSVYFFQGDAELQTYSGPPKAIIIDQLYDELPNETFHTRATEYLEKAGFKVDIVTTKNVTVDFYKNLPKMNYKYVIVRTHGAENLSDVVLFTGERYSEDKYIQEQLFGQVKKAAPLFEISYKVGSDDSSKWIVVNETDSYLITSANPVDDTGNEFFAISPELIEHGMNGKFDDTVFILGGCNTLSNPSLAKSLIDRGASVVLGWDNAVSNSDNDNAILFVLSGVFENNLDFNQALKKIPDFIPPQYMAYPSNFTSYSDSDFI